MNSIAIKIVEHLRDRVTHVPVVHTTPEGLLQKIALSKYNQLKDLHPTSILRLSTQYATIEFAGTVLWTFSIDVEYIPANAEEEQ